MPTLARSDLQVCSHGTAAGNAGITAKQFSLLSLPDWERLAAGMKLPDRDNDNDFHFVMLSRVQVCLSLAWDCRSGELPQDYMHVWLNVGDAGPDQAGFRSSLHTEFATRSDYDFMLLFSVACLKHQYHLAARGQLALADWCLKAMGKDFKYFSSIATLSHTWRGHLKKLRSTWARLHDDDASVYANKWILLRTPPVAIAGRWASMDSCVAT